MVSFLAFTGGEKEISVFANHYHYYKYSEVTMQDKEEQKKRGCPGKFEANVIDVKSDYSEG